MTNQIDSVTNISKMLRDSDFKNDFEHVFLTNNPFGKEGINLLVASNKSSFVDLNLGASFMQICDYLQIPLQDFKIEDKNEFTDPDFAGENWLAHKPFVYTNGDNLAELNIVPAQIHINKTSSIYLVDNQRVLKNLTLNAFEVNPGPRTYMHMNTYGKLLDMPIVDNPSNLVDALQTESKAFDPFKTSFEKERFMEEKAIFVQLKNAYQKANGEIERYTSTIRV